MKINNRKTAHYAFSIYALHDGEEEFVECFEFDLLGPIEKYIG